MAHDKQYDDHPDIGWTLFEKNGKKYTCGFHKHGESVFACDNCGTAVDGFIFMEDRRELCKQCFSAETGHAN